MKRLLLAGLAALPLSLAVPASAQYYDSPDYPSYEEEWRPAPRYDYDRPSYGVRPRRDYDRRDDYGYERRDYRYAQPRREGRRQGQRFGNVCVTSRGSCEYSQSLPITSRCRCDIPGFGPKRGNIEY